MNPADYCVPIPSAFLDALADRLAERLADRLDETSRPSAGWMRTKEAAEYLGLTRSALYSRTHEVPHYRFERTLLFKRRELDAWVESHRVQPPEQAGDERGLAISSTSRTKSSRRRPGADTPQTAEGPKKGRQRERPLPPPLSGDEAQKRNWANQLEISREELDEMAPGDFKRAWDARNEFLKAGGVFDHLDELWELLGQDRIDSMKPSELVAAVRELPNKPNDQRSARGDG